MVGEGRGLLSYAGYALVSVTAVSKSHLSSRRSQSCCTKELVLSRQTVSLAGKCETY
jgi:hypothetical protein